jgi:hypothetical protein
MEATSQMDRRPERAATMLPREEMLTALRERDP